MQTITAIDEIEEIHRKNSSLSSEIEGFNFENQEKRYEFKEFYIFSFKISSLHAILVNGNIMDFMILFLHAKLMGKGYLHGKNFDLRA